MELCSIHDVPSVSPARKSDDVWIAAAPPFGRTFGRSYGRDTCSGISITHWLSFSITQLVLYLVEEGGALRV